MTTAPWTPGYVDVDDRLGPFACELNGQRWNGWACPRFTRETALQVAAAVERSTRWDGDVLLTTYDESDEDEWERWEPDAEGFYHVGSWAWCWTVVALTDYAEGETCFACGDGIEVDDEVWIEPTDGRATMTGEPFHTYCAPPEVFSDAVNVRVLSTHAG